MKKETNLLFHTPVLLNEVLEFLRVKPGFWYIDATVGGGGHTKKILEQGGRVLGIDQDTEAIERLKGLYAEEIKSGQLVLVEENFSKLSEIVENKKVTEVAGVLFDLGMSTYQIRSSGRGFSFWKDEILDMRMSGKTEKTARDVINRYGQEELADIFTKYGEEILGKQIALRILEERAKKDIETTTELANLVVDEYKKRRMGSHIHPATKVFQAIRIEVNGELDRIETVLRDSFQILRNGGRCLVISFHSLEDRIVKRTYLKGEATGIGRIITKKPVIAHSRETRENPAARSAKLRVFEKM